MKIRWRPLLPFARTLVPTVVAILCCSRRWPTVAMRCQRPDARFIGDGMVEETDGDVVSDLVGGKHQIERCLHALLDRRSGNSAVAAKRRSVRTNSPRPHSAMQHDGLTAAHIWSAALGIGAGLMRNRLRAHHGLGAAPLLTLAYPGPGFQMISMHGLPARSGPHAWQWHFCIRLSPGHSGQS